MYELINIADVMNYINNCSDQRELNAILSGYVKRTCDLSHTDTDRNNAGFHCDNCHLKCELCLRIQTYLVERSSISGDYKRMVDEHDKN